MTSSVLWLDNDPGWMGFHVDALREAGIVVNTATSAMAAEDALLRTRYDLVIIDAMLPALTDEPGSPYNRAATADGENTGVVFFKRMREHFHRTNSRVLVLTVRMDDEVGRMFVNEGLREGHLETKMDVRDTRDFVRRVTTILSGGATAWFREPNEV